MGEANGIAAPPARRWYGLGLSASTIGLLLVIDQLLLPMFHIGGMPLKPTYLLVGLWAVDQMTRPPSGAMDDWQRRRLWDVSAAMGLIAGCALLGGLYFGVRFGRTDVALTLKNITMLALAALSFGVGITSTQFRMRWLVYVLAASLALNLLFIILRSRLPGWIMDLYFPPLAVDNLARLGVATAGDLLELGRPRGITSNPNGSALMINIIALFVYAGLRFRLIPRPGAIVSAMIVFMPMVLCLVLASRGEFIAAAILALCNLRLLFGGASTGWRLRMMLVCVVLVAGGLFGASRIGLGETVVQNVQRIAGIMRILDQAEIARAGGDVQTESVARPLLTAGEAGKRFVLSPLIGSGYATTLHPPYDYGTDYFHNDWFWLAVTSGLLGVGAMIWFIARYVVPLSPVLVLPFLLPGLVNTFMLNIPVMMFYFFMIGVLLVQLHVRELAHWPGGSPSG